MSARYTYECSACGWRGTECARVDHYPMCLACGYWPLDVSRRQEADQ